MRLSAGCAKQTCLSSGLCTSRDVRPNSKIVYVLHLADRAVQRAVLTVPLPGDGFGAVLGLEQAARYDVADQMGLDAFSAETGGAAAAVDNESQATPWTPDSSGALAADSDMGEAAVPQWAGGQRQLMATAASSCIGATFTVVPVGRLTVNTCTGCMTSHDEFYIH